MSAQTRTQVISNKLMQELELLTIQAPTLEIALTALRLQTAIKSYEFIVDHCLTEQAFFSQGDEQSTKQ